MALSGSSSLRSFSTTGITKARVFPEPVQASTATSLCPQNSGIVASCTGVAMMKPSSVSTASVAGDTPASSLKRFGAPIVSEASCYGAYY